MAWFPRWYVGPSQGKVFECGAKSRNQSDNLGQKKLIEAKPMASYMIWKVENKHGLDLHHWVGALGKKTALIKFWRGSYPSTNISPPPSRSRGHDSLGKGRLLPRPLPLFFFFVIRCKTNPTDKIIPPLSRTPSTASSSPNRARPSGSTRPRAPSASSSSSWPRRRACASSPAPARTKRPGTSSSSWAPTRASTTTRSPAPTPSSGWRPRAWTWCTRTSAATTSRRRLTT